MTEAYIEELIEKYALGTASEKEIQQLMQWYQSAPVKEVQWQTSTPGEKQELYNRMLQRMQHDISPKRGRLYHFSWLKVAAILLIVAGAGFAVFHFSGLSQSYITVTNPSGKIQLLHLPDSSAIWLNARSEIRYVKSFKKNREVELKGEAYFEVTHDKEHPFTIKTGDIKTMVLGTSFNIKAYETDNITAVTVSNGSVKVSNDSEALAILKPSSQLKYDRQRQLATTSTIDTSYVLAWKKGKLQFDGETLGDIVTTLERWYNIKIAFANPAMRNCRYYMSFENTSSLEKLLSTMAEITEMQYSIDKNKTTITFSGKGCQ